MNKMREYERGREDGFDLALRIVRQGGLEALEKEQYVVEVAEDIRQRAWAPIEKMLQIK